MSDTPSLLPEDDKYVSFLTTLKARIRGAQLRAALSVNQELLLLYWNIGRDLLARQQQEGWGSKIITRLAKDLKQEFPEIKGFSRSNLFYMRSFADAYPDEQLVQRCVGLIPWRHNIALLDKVKDPQERLWYAAKVIEEGWNRDILVLQIETNLYQRQGGAITNFERTLPPIQSDLSHQLLKDPYNFQFLSAQETKQEADLERGLLLHIRDFLLELGVGFAFLGSQYPLTVEGREFRLDLLFYHTQLRCYVVIELKMGEFEPEYSGKMNFYVEAVNNLMRHEQDQPTIGIILCRSKNQTVVEFALGSVQNPIGVATYKLREDLPDVLQQNFPTAEQLQLEVESALSDMQPESDSGNTA